MSTRTRRFFNIAGPCQPARHYMVPALARLPDLGRLVEEHQFFSLHAPRQSGKTTVMRAAAEALRAEGHLALHLTLETSRHIDELAAAEALWLAALRQAAELALPQADQPPPDAALDAAPGARLGQLLRRWCLLLRPRMLVLFLDEVDGVAPAPLVNLLSQLRAGFPDRPDGFPAAIALIGLRDLKDYLTVAKGGQPPNPSSPFNIKAQSLTLDNFTRAEVEALYAQHTEEHDQAFTDAAIDRALYWTGGQPYLINALAYQLTRHRPIPLSEPITAAHIDAAKEALIQARTTHLDNLHHRLYEPRVAAILRPLLLGDTLPTADEDDIAYAIDLGLVSRQPGGLGIANPLYREILPRALASVAEVNVPTPWWPWRTADGRLNMPALLDEFQSWWRRHGDLLIEQSHADWREAAAHLTFMAFLQRVVNGGGTIEREIGTGRGRMDLLVSYGGERIVIELKRIPARGSATALREEGIAQLAGYLDQQGQREGWLLLFDQRPGRTWEQRIFAETFDHDGKRIHLRGA